MNDAAAARARMVAGEAASGRIHDERVLAAMARVPREEFVPSELRPEAYAEHALPIAAGQTISQPFVVALMSEASEVEPGDRVLEIGTGSGYQAAVLATMGASVVSVERIPELAATARATLARLGIDAVEVHVGDGTLGWAPGAPYDAIVVTAGGPEVPAALAEQLVDGGRLVIPVGPRDGERLVRVRRRGAALEREDLGAVRFVPLVGAGGWPDEG